MEMGDTFRINVGTTKPYNADFDGDKHESIYRLVTNRGAPKRM
jgi:DNA-directed RNA polymerase beta' subunit